MRKFVNLFTNKNQRIFWILFEFYFDFFDLSYFYTLWSVFVLFYVFYLGFQAFKNIQILMIVNMLNISLFSLFIFLFGLFSLLCVFFNIWIFQYILCLFVLLLDFLLTYLLISIGVFGDVGIILFYFILQLLYLYIYYKLFYIFILNEALLIIF